MGPKKKKKGKKKKEKKEGDEEENKEELNPAFNIALPEYGWIRIELRLCDPPTTNHNKFLVVMRTSDRILELKKRIIEYHGRIDNISIYNKDPIPPRDKSRMRQDKPRVPPYGQNARLRALYLEKTEKDERAEIKAKRRQKAIDDGKGDEISEDEEPEVIKSDDPFNKTVPVDKYEELKHWDFPVSFDGNDIFEYDEKELSLYEIFGQYGTVVKPKLNYQEDDPTPPEKKEKPIVKPPTPKKPKEDGDEEEDGEEKADIPPVEEEPEEEVYVPPLHKILYYDFSTYKNAILKKEDPILLALMVKGENDVFTL